MSNKIVNFKCIFKDRPEDDFIINSSELKKVFPVTSKDGESRLWVDYYDDDLCLVTSCICDYIVPVI